MATGPATPNSPLIGITIVDNGVIAALGRARNALASKRKFHKAAGAVLEKRQQQRFDTKTAPSGRDWAKWSPATAAARAKEGRGTLLEYTGKLRDSLAYTASETGMTIGFGVPYAGNVASLRPLLFENGRLAKPDESAVLAAALEVLRKQMRL